MSGITKDTSGNQLRKSDGQWQILKHGVGWVEFVGFTVLEDGRMIDTREQRQATEQEVANKSVEDDLFRHYAGIALNNTMRRVSMDNVEVTPPRMAKCAADCAQAMIDELKKRGRL